MNNPITKARWVLKTKGITGIPAESLHDIADSEDIRYLYRTLPNDPKLGGQLLYKGKKKGIIVNTLIDNKGRQNFTFTHELGHYFLDHPPNYSLDGQLGFWCSTDDIGNGKKPREVEANHFAVELLMPEDRFRIDMIGAPLDFGIINGLANRYMVSKHACSNRILGLTHSPCVIIRIQGNKIVGSASSLAARNYLRRLDTVPENTAAHLAITNTYGSDDFVTCDAGKWLMRTIPGNKVYECTHVHRDSGTAMIILKW